MSFTDFLESGILDYFFGKLTFTPSGTLYFALSTTTPNDVSTWNFTEPSETSGYARAGVANDKVSFTVAPNSGIVRNNILVSFPQATGNWGSITHFGIFDETGLNPSGNLYAWGNLDVAKTINDGDTAQFAISGVTITLD